MNNIKLTVIFVFFLVSLTPALLSLGIRYIPVSELPQIGGSVKVYGEVTTTFLIKNQKDGLVGLNLYAKNPTRNDNDLKFSLFDLNNQLVRDTEADGFYIQNGELTKLSFIPLPKGEYKAVLSSSSGNYENAIEVYMEKNSDNLAYVLLYKPVSRLSLIGSIYLGWFKHLFGVK